MSENKKINLLSCSDLKTNCDEHLDTVLSYEYKQDFTIVDIKIVLSYLSVIIAGLTFYLDKKFNNDFQNQFYYQATLYCVIAFYIVLVVGYFFSKKVEKNVKFVWFDSKKKKLSVSSELREYEPVYDVTIDFDGKSVHKEIPFTSLYNKEGFLQLDVFKKTLGDEIAVLKKSKN